MSESFDSLPPMLSEALARALERTTGTSLDCLHHLRDTVTGYAYRQGCRGVPLDEIVVAVGGVLMAVEDEVAPGPIATETRDPELARQVRAWCAEGYNRAS